MAMGSLRNQVGTDAKMQGEKGWRRHIAASPDVLLRRRVRRIHQRLGAGLRIVVALSREGVPARGIGNHPTGADGRSVGERDADCTSLLHHDFGDAGLVADGTSMALHPTHQFFSDDTHATFRIVDPTGMAVGEDHSRVDHRCAVRGHHRPAETLDVDELEQLFILDVLPRHRADVEGQPPGQPKACQWCLEKHLGQIGGILQRQQRHRIEVIEHLPAGVVELADARGLMGKTGRQLGDEALVIPVDGNVEPPGMWYSSCAGSGMVSQCSPTYASKS